MNSLIIGSTSQLSYYFPEEYERVSSEHIRMNGPLPLHEEYYDRVFITFAEQRLDHIKDFRDYIETNTSKTLKLINFFRTKCNAVIVYGSCELWSKYTGPISLDYDFDYDLHSKYTGYCISKHLLSDLIHEEDMGNVFMLHPFNFNSPYRKPGFLFSKIFDSIINKKKIEIGDTYIYRDLIHPKYVVERSIKATEDEIIGSGRLTLVNRFIRDLYDFNGMIYEEYVSEVITPNAPKNAIYLNTDYIMYKNLLQDTLEDIKEKKNEIFRTSTTR